MDSKKQEMLSWEDKVSRLTYEKQHFQQQSAQVEAKNRALDARLQALTRLTQLPETLLEVVE